MATILYIKKLKHEFIMFFVEKHTFVCYNKMGDTMEKIIMHIDVNNAFLSWSALDLLNQGYQYDIRDSYAAIGGDETKRRGIVLAKSTPAKKMGVKTGEPLYVARKKCPSLRVYTPNYIWYQMKSKQLFTLLSTYTDDIEVASIDECYLDYGKVKNLYGDEIIFANHLKNQIYQELGFTINIGIARNKLCAKMASDFLKPNMVHTLFEEEIETKMYPLSIEELFGIGKKSSQKLRELGIDTIGKLAQADPNLLYKHFKNQAMKMIESARGIDNSIVVKTKEENKGISNSTTLEKDATTKIEIEKALEQLVNNVAITLRKQKKYAYVIAVILKDRYFKSYSHQKKLVNATNLTEEIFKVSKQLLKDMWNLEPVRLVGIRLDHLVTTSNHQVSLFEEIKEREQNVKLEQVMDELKEKYGFKIIKNASLNDTIHKKYLK